MFAIESDRNTRRRAADRFRDRGCDLRLQSEPPREWLIVASDQLDGDPNPLPCSDRIGRNIINR